MNNIEQYRKRFYNLMESTMGDVRPIIDEQKTKVTNTAQTTTTNAPNKPKNPNPVRQTNTPNQTTTNTNTANTDTPNQTPAQNYKKFKMGGTNYAITNSEKVNDEFYEIQYSRLMSNGMIEKNAKIGYIGNKNPNEIYKNANYDSYLGTSDVSLFKLLNIVIPIITPSTSTENNVVPMTKQQETEYINKFANMISDDMQIGKKSMYSKKLNLEIKFKFKGDFLVIDEVKIPSNARRENNIRFKERVDVSLDFRVHPTFDENGAKTVVSQIMKKRQEINNYNSNLVGKLIDYKGIGKTKGNKPILSPDTPYDGIEV